MGSSFKISHFYIRGVIIILLTGIYNNLAAQNKPSSVSPLPKSVATKFASQNNNDLYNTHSVFIENVGQYGETIQGYEAMGKILYGYEGMGMPFLFSTKGIIQLQRKIELAKEKDENEEPEEALRNAKITNKVIMN